MTELNFNITKVRIKISKKSKWDKLVINKNKRNIELRDNITKRADGILFANIDKDGTIKNGYKTWNWNDQNTLCKSHKLSKGGGINLLTVIKTLNYLDTMNLNIILSKGYHDVLETEPKLIKSLNKKYKVYNLNSNKAIELYNKLTDENAPVLLFLHSTC